MPDSPAILNQMSLANCSRSANELKSFSNYRINFAFAGKTLPSVRYSYNKQVHGTTIVEAQARQENAVVPADGIWTREPGLVVAIRTADCLPILFSDKQSSFVMAVHAGWRGLTSGIVSAAINTITSLGVEPGEVIAAIGPAISRERYEVGPEVVSALYSGSTLSETQAGICIAKGFADRWFLDLQSAALLNLLTLGIKAEQIDLIKICTFESPDFFSYRREGKGVGSNISWISI